MAAKTIEYQWDYAYRAVATQGEKLAPQAPHCRWLTVLGALPLQDTSDFSIKRDRGF